MKFVGKNINLKKFDEKNEKRLIIFLYQLLNENNLSIHDLTKEVIAWMKVEFWCELNDFMEVLITLRKLDYVNWPANNIDLAYFTEKGIKYVKELMLKYGRINVNFNIQDKQLSW